LRTHLLLTPRGSATCCRSSDPLLLMLRSRTGAWSAPRLHIIRCHLRGEELRSKSRLPGRSLLPSSTLEHVSVIRSSRTFDRSAHQYFRSGSRDPPDLGANNPTRSGPCDPAAKPGFLSWGCPKIAPPSYRSRNPTPGDVLPGVAAGPCSAHRFLGRWRGARRLLRDGNANSHPRAAHVVFHHFDGLFLLDPAAIAGRCRSWGSPRFLLSRNRIPRCAPAALRSLPSADSDGC